MSTTSGNSRSKKTTTKKVGATTAAKKPTSTKVSKPTVPKKAQTKTSKKATVKTKTTTKSKPASRKEPSKPKTAKTVVLPDSFGIRVKEKALVLSQAFETDFYPAARNMAMYGGMCFLAVGAVATLQFLPGNMGEVCDQPGCGLSATIIDSTGSTTTETSGGTEPGTVTEPAEPLVENTAELLSELPSVITEPTVVRVKVTNAVEFVSRVHNLQFTSNNPVFMQHEQLDEERFEIFIEPKDLIPDTYRLKIEVFHSNTSQPAFYTLGTFNVPPPADEPVEEIVTTEPVDPGIDTDPIDILNINTDDDATDASNTGTGGSGGTTSTEPVETQPAGTTSDKEEDKPVETVVEEVDQTTNDVVKEPIDTVVDETDTVTEKQPVETASYTVELISQKNLSGTKMLQLSTVGKYQNIIVYIRKATSLNSERVRILDGEQRSFIFDTTRYPNGEYELYAQARTDIGTFVQSDPQEIRIYNEINTEPITESESESESEPVPVPRETFNPESELSAVETQDQDTGILSIKREPIETSASGDTNTTFEPTSVNSESTEDATTEVINDPIREQVKEKLRDTSTELDRLLTAYSAAQQTGDEILIAQAEAEIQSYRRGLIDDAMVDERLRFVARELDETLGQELESFQAKVRTFEAVRRDRTEEQSAIDSDGDGISDIDERELYKTDPNLADSDNDGFLDGVEIVSGFNPLDDTAEVPVVYESPKETIGVVRTEKLVVEAVIPDVQLEPVIETEVVQTVVRGKGLPNSFVTLYVFSTPTIVTVRTESDGSFEYTFSKELEDGQHEVFVALTDNAGVIVAQSEPFTFIKEAQAFTPVDALATEETIASNSAPSQESPYRLVLGMSVLALGILLILLGVGLRGNKPDIVIEETPA